MKKLLAIAATLAASSAFAGVKLEVRSDYINTPAYDDNTGAEVASTSVFTPVVARLYLSGNVGDAQIDSGWNLRAFTPEFQQSSAGGAGAHTTLSKTMTVDKFVDHLWIAKSMGDWTFKAGKLENNTGGFEHAKVVHGDTYLTSLAAGGVGGDTNTGTVTTPENASGVSAAYTITPEHKLEFQLLNSTNGQTMVAGELSTDKRHNMGLAYMGSFLNKMIQANISYIIGSGDTINIGTDATTNHEQNFMSAGLRFLPMENLTLDVDYLANSDKTAAGKAQTNSTILEARYAMGMYTPVFKYEMSTDKDKNGDDNFKRDAWALALEVAPKADESFRYHVAYASVKDKDFAAANTSDVTQNVITVGIKYAGDIAK
ncbi:MAG: hypothetical protein ACKOX6_13730 [Bdellovibrio sp.]